MENLLDIQHVGGGAPSVFGTPNTGPRPFNVVVHLIQHCLFLLGSFYLLGDFESLAVARRQQVQRKVFVEDACLCSRNC